MYICSCHAVTDHVIRRLVLEGKIKTFRELARTTGCGTQCGRCAKGAKEIFDAAMLELAEKQGLAAVAALTAQQSADSHTGEDQAEAVAQSEGARRAGAEEVEQVPAKSVPLSLPLRTPVSERKTTPALELDLSFKPCSANCNCTCESKGFKPGESKGAAPAAPVPPSAQDQARELARGAEVLPGGDAEKQVAVLAERIQKAMDEGRPLRVKLGVDPTSANLHLGHAVVLRKLKRFQDFGHQVVLIIGGFTAQVGDPSGRNTTRPVLTAEQVAQNARTYLDQVGKVLDLERAEVVNNSDWFGTMPFARLLELTSRVTVNQLLAKDGFGERIANQQPLALTELFYPVMQGFDSVAVRADIEIGGSDQRFNLLSGRQLQPQFDQEPQLAVLLPLLEGTDGVRKMSKSFGNHIGLADAPDDIFAGVMRLPDSLIVKFFELATTLDGTSVDAVKATMDSGGNPRDAKLELARRIITELHDRDAAEQAASHWMRLHSERLAPEVLEEIAVDAPKSLTRLMVELQFATSNNNARSLIEGGAVRIDGKKVDDARLELTDIPAAGLVLQVGRRRFVRVVAAAK